MERFSFENQGARTYLVYSVGDVEDLDAVGLGMLTNNRIPGFANALFSQMDTQRYIKYDISSRVTLQHAFSGVVSKRRLIGAFLGIVDALTSIEEYMLDESQILLDANYIFMDISNGNTVVVYLPVNSDRIKYDTKLFFKEIMFNTQFDQTENCSYVAKIINYLNSTQSIVPTDFRALLSELDQTPNTAPTTVKQRAEAPAQRAEQQPVERAVEQERPIVQRKQEISLLYSAPNSGKALEMPIPPVREAVSTPIEQAGPVNEEPPADEERMSTLYLLRHYSKENVEKYSAQKKKSAAASNASGKQAQARGADSKKSNQKAKSAISPAGNMGFAMPGQETKYTADKIVAPEPAVPPIPQPVQQTVPAQKPVATPVAASVAAQPAAPHRIQEQFAVQFDETFFLNDGDETVILNEEHRAEKFHPYLLRKKNGERIPIDKEVFRLGRDVDFNDYALVDNRFVGHSHCHILSRDGEYFVIDDNSKNHTRVNGKQITPGEEVKIAHEYVICVADDELEFRLF